MDVNITATKDIPDTVYALAQQVQRGFQQKKMKPELLKQLGQQLWACSNLTIDLQPNSRLVVQQHMDLPWECLYHPNHGFIARQYPVFRQPQQSRSISTFSNFPLKILHFTAQPTQFNQHYLDFAAEQQAIYESLWSFIQARQVLLYSQTVGYFASWVELLKQDWDIVILSAHSLVKKGQPYLVFESTTMPYQLIHYDEIIAHLQKTKIKCVVLAFCESASLSQQLHLLGIPHVIGMQYTVLDRAASMFIQHFLTAIVQNKSILNAVHVARLQMQHLLQQNEQWQANEIGQYLIPCLYTQMADDILFSHTLPIHNKIKLHAFIARRQIRYEVEQLLLKHQKVWLYGVGGVGKTALAQALQQSFTARHWAMNYVECDAHVSNKSHLPMLAVSRFPAPNHTWYSLKLSTPSEQDFICYAYFLDLQYPILQLRLIYKVLQGNYQGLNLLSGLPFSTNATILRQQLYKVKRYLQAYQRKC